MILVFSHQYSSISDKHLSYMACRLVGMQLLFCSLLLAGGSSVVNGFTQVTGSTMVTSQCGVQQGDPQLVAAGVFRLSHPVLK